MKLNEILVTSRDWNLGAEPDADALRELDALVECQLLGLRFDAVASTVWILLDCRGALQIEVGNTAVVSARGVQEVSWKVDHREGWRALPVVGSTPSIGGLPWSLSIKTLEGGRLHLVAHSADFMVGNVPGCDAAPPDFELDDALTIRNGLAGWESIFDLVYATSIGRLRST
jgi:hypothetical protein